MTDIVERLRDPARVGRTPARWADIMTEAADEIERLRAALRQIANGDTCIALASHPPICARARTARAVLEENKHD